jgi:putative NADPH-quinone reductase
MRCLVVYAHPVESSYCAACGAKAVATLQSAQHEVRLLDLYAEGFDPVLSRQERLDYHSPGANEKNVRPHVELIKWAEALVFVYPTWWYGLPAILKGWLDRVWLPSVAFTLPKTGRPIRGMMDNIVRIVASRLRARHAGGWRSSAIRAGGQSRAASGRSARHAAARAGSRITTSTARHKRRVRRSSSGSAASLRGL